MVVVVHTIGELEAYLLPTNHPEFDTTQPLIYSIGGHDNNEIVLLFHSKHMKRHIIKLATQCIHTLQILVDKVSIDIITIHIFNPVLSILDYIIYIYDLLFYIKQYLQET